jgi:hypothetical protein
MQSIKGGEMLSVFAVVMNIMWVALHGVEHLQQDRRRAAPEVVQPVPKEQRVRRLRLANRLNDMMATGSPTPVHTRA